MARPYRVGTSGEGTQEGSNSDALPTPHPLPNLRVPGGSPPLRASPTQRNLLRGGRVAEGIDEMTHEEMAQAVEHQRLSLTPGSKAYKALTEAAAALRRLDMARVFMMPETGIRIEAREGVDKRWVVINGSELRAFDTLDEAFAAVEKAAKS